MEVKFCKYHGAGNDFVMVDNRVGEYHLNEAIVAAMCSRRLGIGADGLIEIGISDTLDFKMLYYNSDGRQGSLCGNGSRCALAFALKLGIRCSLVSPTEIYEITQKCPPVLSEDHVEDLSGSQSEMVMGNEFAKENEGISLANKAVQASVDVEERRKSENVVSSNSEDITAESGKELADEKDEKQAFTDSYLKYVFEASDGIHAGYIERKGFDESGKEVLLFHVKLNDVEFDKVKIYEDGSLFVYTGSPHHVTFVTNPVETLDVVKKGRDLRYGLYGEEGSNVNFVNELRMPVNHTDCLDVQNNSSSNKNVTQAVGGKENSGMGSVSQKETTNNDGSKKSSNIDNSDKETECENSTATPAKDFDDVILMTRTYERGVEDETLACGTGAVAVAIADHVIKYLKSDVNNTEDGVLGNKNVYEKKRNESGVVITAPKTKQTLENNQPEVTLMAGCEVDSDGTEKRIKRTIKMPGGVLSVTFTVKTEENSTNGRGIVFSDVVLSGPAKHVFDGVYSI